MSLTHLRWFYFVSIGALGGTIPMLGARLEASGMSGRDIGLIMAMLPLGRILSGPVWGVLADRSRRAGALLRVGCVIALVGTVLFLVPSNLAVAAIASLLFSVGRMPMGPLVDAFTLDALTRAGLDQRSYGSIRLWGSLGFLVMALASGAAVDHLGVDPLWPGIVLGALTFFLSFGFPSEGEGGPAPILPALRELARVPGFRAFLGFIALHALATSVYDTFFSVHVQALGLPALTTPIAMAAGIVVEIGIMARGEALMRRWSPAQLMLLAAVCAVPRWALTGTATTAAAIVALQCLHGITFGCFWLGAVQWTAERAPREVSASAQSLLATVSYGLGALAGAFLAGELRARMGTGAVFEAIAGLSAIGAIFAWRVRAADAAWSQRDVGVSP